MYNIRGTEIGPPDSQPFLAEKGFKRGTEIGRDVGHPNRGTETVQEMVVIACDFFVISGNPPLIL